MSRTTRPPLKQGGDDNDAFGRWGRRYLCCTTRTGMRSAIKTAYRRRVRHKARQEARDAARLD